MDKIRRLEKYLFDFFSTRVEDLNIFYHTTHRDRQYGIYKLKDGNVLMDFLIGIHSQVEEKFYSQNLIPQKFATPESLLTSLDWFKKYLNENQKYLDANFGGEETDYIIHEIQKIKNELIEAIDYTKIIYDYEDTVIPYQELRYKLITNNIPDFINILKAILASVSYAITHFSEGFFHSNIHLILKLLGFEILSEEMTNNGRIDAVIRFSDKIYIVEFKFNDDKDLSEQALQQIKDKEYRLKFTMEKKDIFGIGISFSKTTKNINGFKTEKLN
ncbi:MAG: PD-(D/E)XK nuclease domain-containing protein [Crocinitomicaceae bacterium]|nr:PD-(D/E)XK nuclease domain-containing protein [Crocinitomicaceae bacterium]MBK8925017.1 PD-(D/E)XK nuclease domain-containing protein [Crocinitomicaceae bacterium]